MARILGYGITAAVMFSFLAVTVFAAGSYSGYSSIALNTSSVTVALGGTASVGYTVNLISGTTWGTNFVINNQSQLQQKGIYLSASPSSGDPPFNGTLTVQLTQYAAAGTYTAVLSATGDDPTTSNTTLTIVVSSSAPTVTASLNTTSPHTSYGSSSNGYELPFGAAIFVIIIIGGILAATRKTTPGRLILLGVILILIGMAVWLYGDYSGGNFSFIWGGVALIVIGILVWLAGDFKAIK
jgi:hypothetical protein